MKKVLKYFSLLVLVLFVVTGCGSTKKDGTATLEASFKKMEDIKSLSMNMGIDVDVEAEGSSISMKMNMNGSVDENKNMHMNMSTSMLGMSEEQEMYMVQKDGLMYTYTRDSEDGWYYTTSEIGDLDLDFEMPTSEEIEELKEMMLSFSTITEEKSDKDGYTKLVVKIDKEKLFEIMEEEEGLTKKEIETELAELGDFEIPEIVVYVKDGYVSIIEIDLGGIMGQIMMKASAVGEDSTETMPNMSAKLTIELSDFNKVGTITVPSDVLDNAVSYDDYYGDDYYYDDYDQYSTTENSSSDEI